VISKMLHCGLVLGIAVGVTMRLARSAEPDSHAALAVSASESSLLEDGIYPHARKLAFYNPNHRDAKTLLPIAKQVDIVAKGCYVNTVGRKRDRAWVRWSVEQEIEALRAGGRAQAIPLLMPELCKDPESEEDKEIRAWVRQDVYLGLASGAKGVLIWSLFKRKEVKRTWQLWYDAYSECARELNGPRGLAQVFLFGERQSTLKVAQVQGSAAAKVTLGGSAEAATTTDQERAQREVKFPSWTSAEFVYRGSRWFFLVKSANAPAAFTVNDCPPGSGAKMRSQASRWETGATVRGVWIWARTESWDCVSH